MLRWIKLRGTGHADRGRLAPVRGRDGDLLDAEAGHRCGNQDLSGEDEIVRVGLRGRSSREPLAYRP